MKLCQPLFALVTLVFTAGCATAPASPILRQSVIVDQKGVDPVAYATDLRECEAYAAQVATGQEVAVNAAGGAVLGGALGAVGGSTKDARRGATAGAVIGSTKGVADAMESKNEVLRNCLRGRGYRVLN